MGGKEIMEKKIYELKINEKLAALFPPLDTTEYQMLEESIGWAKQFLMAHPLCVQCMAEGRYVRATVVDHIVPHRGDQKLFWDRSNWQALCKAHHDKKTGLEDSRPTYHF